MPSRHFNSRSWVLLCIIVFLCATFVLSEELYIYVSKANGSDEFGDGSYLLPFQTLNKGLQYASESTTIYLYYGFYNEGLVNITQTQVNSLKLIAPESGVYVNGTILSDEYIHLRIENLNLISGGMVLDIHNVHRLEIFNSTVDGYTMVNPYFYNRFMHISFIDSTFKLSEASNDIVFVTLECQGFFSAVNNTFQNTTLTIKRRCINDLDVVTNIELSKNRFYLPKFILFMEHTSSGYPYNAISFYGKKDTHILARQNFWNHEHGPQTCCNIGGRGSVVGLNVDYQEWCKDPQCLENETEDTDVECIRNGCKQRLTQTSHLIIIIASVIAILSSSIGSFWMVIAYRQSGRVLQDSLAYFLKTLVNCIITNIASIIIAGIMIESTDTVMVQIHATRASGFAYLGSCFSIAISCVNIIFSVCILVVMKKEKNGFIIFHRIIKPYFVVALSSFNILLLKVISESLFYANFYRWKAVIVLSPLTYYTYTCTVPQIVVLLTASLSSWKVKEHIFKSDIKKIKQHIRQNPFLIVREDTMQKSDNLNKEARKSRVTLYISLVLWILFTGFSITFTLLNGRSSTLANLNILLSVASSTGVLLLIFCIFISYRYNRTSSLLTILLVSMVHTILTQSILISWSIAYYGIKSNRNLVLFILGIILSGLCIISRIVDSIQIHILRQKVSNERYELILNNITAIEHQSLLTM